MFPAHIHKCIYFFFPQYLAIFDPKALNLLAYLKPYFLLPTTIVYKKHFNTH